MASEIVRRGKREISSKDGAIAKARGSKHAKKTAKNAKTHTATKHPRKSVAAATQRVVYAADHGQMTAFHHMQRASVVMSLMEKGTGRDLRQLLERGVKLYRRAMEEEAKDKVVLRAIGVLRAVEHLAMAGLYSARRKHRQKVVSPTPEWLAKVVGETFRRLEELEQRDRDKGKDLLPVTVELLRQAKDSDIDAHLAFELAMAGDALCFALENGL